MPKRRWVWTVATGSLLVGWGSVALANDDWQLWMEQKWSVKLAKTLQLAGKTEERWRQDMSDFYSQIASSWLSWKLLPWLKLEPGYHYQWTEQAGRDTNENRLFLNLTPSWAWKPFKTEVRHRLEFRHINGLDDWRLRLKPKLSVELGRDRYELGCYVADEVFYGHRAGEWNRNRVFVGFEKQFNVSLSTELYYGIESNKTGRDWNEFHILGLAASLKF